MIFICQNSAFRVKTIHWKKKMSLNFDFCTSLCFNMLTFHCVLLQESLNQGIYNDFNCLHKTLLVSMVPILCSFPEFFQLIFVSGDVAPKSLPCFTCCCSGELLASNFVMFNLSVKAEIVSSALTSCWKLRAPHRPAWGLSSSFIFPLGYSPTKCMRC